MPSVIIRAYTPADRAGIRTIACDTADRGQPVERLFSDRAVTADLLTRYYTDYEPVAVWVAEYEGRVIGYLTGCFNSRRYWRIMLWRIGPAAVLRAIGGGALWSGQTWRLLWAGLRTWLRGGLNRQVPFDRYPAHLHVNLQEGFRGQQVGRRLVEQFLSQAHTAGLRGIHVAVRENNEAARRLFERLGFSLIGHHHILRPRTDMGESARAHPNTAEAGPATEPGHPAKLGGAKGVPLAIGERPAAPPRPSSPRRTIAVVGSDRAAGGEEVSERAGDPTGRTGASAPRHPPESFGMSSSTMIYAREL